MGTYSTDYFDYVDGGTPWVTDTTSGTGVEDYIKYPTYPTDEIQIPSLPSPDMMQILRLTLMTKIQEILQPFQYCELDKDDVIAAKVAMVNFLTIWEGAGILTAYSIDIQENSPQAYTVYIQYSHVFSSLSEHMAVPLLGHPGWEGKDVELPQDPVTDNDSKKRLKDLIL